LVCSETECSCRSSRVGFSLLTRNHASDGQDLALDAAKARRL
jgi:hypothetical protein